MAAFYYPKQVAVLGAGTMGAQIAAHFANCGFEVLLFDLAHEGQSKIAKEALNKLKKIEPQPLASAALAANILPCNYDTDLAKLKNCNLVVEAVLEDLKIKQALYEKIDSHLSNETILTSNTSGIPIAALAEVLPERFKSRFLGTHFFNPPRYLPLVELIPHQGTDPAILDQIETCFTTFLGKTIVRAKDTPNFIANRLGVFGLLVTLHHAEALHIPLEVVDQLTGKALGRPKSATCRTMDLVGLDVLGHVIANMTRNLSNDPWHSLFKLPSWLEGLVQKGALGEKTKKGIYFKSQEGLLVWDIQAQHYRKADAKANKEVLEILKIKGTAERFQALRTSSLPEAQFVFRILRDLFHYAAVFAKEIAHSLADIDKAMRLGFGWKEGIFESWQALGWENLKNLLQEEINTRQTLAAVALPAWVNTIKAPFDNGVSYSPDRDLMVTGTSLPVYARQLYPLSIGQRERVYGKTLFENEGARVWTDDEINVVVSFKTKMNTIHYQVLSAIKEAAALAEKGYQGIIIWQPGEHFSAGADLMSLAEKFMLGGPAALDEILHHFQEALLALRYARVPVIAATRGYVLGGGCELMMHCDKTVAALESYIGLVEVGVGLVPAAGGCKEMALRASLAQDPRLSLQQYFKQIGMAEVAKSAVQAKEMGYLRPDDVIISHPDELLCVAKAELGALAAKPYRPPLAPKIKVQGYQAKGDFLAMLANLQAGRYASTHDAFIVSHLANILSGGDLVPDSLVDEAWLLKLEREAFIELASSDKTQERVQYMLENGKPLRN